MSRCRQAGTTMLEALVALSCVCLGAVALARHHTELRQAAEASRQRAEALRLAQSALEAARTTARRTSLVGGSATHEAASAAYTASASSATASACEVGTACTLELATQDSGHPARRAVRVTVSWLERSGAPRQLELASILPSPAASPVVAP